MYDILNVFLENGMRVVMHKIPYIKTMACGIWVKQGSKHEDDNNNGLSHLIEHLMINVDNRNNPKFQSLIEDLSYEGIVYNAGTTKEATSFYFSGLAKNLEKSLHTISSIVIRNKTFDKGLIENEKKVVTQEAISFYSSFNQIKERTSQALWGNIDVGRLIVGGIDNIKAATVDNIEEIIEHAYTPENSTLVIIGGIDYDKTLDIVEENFGEWEDKNTREYTEMVDSEPGIYFNSINNGANSVVSIGFRTCGYTDNNRLSIDLIAKILGDPSLESRLVQEIRMKRGLAYNLGAFTSFYESRGTLGFTAVCAHDSVEEVTKVMINEFNKVKEKGFTDRELNRAKKILETRTLLDLDNLVAQLKFLGKCVSYGRLFSLEEEVRNIQHIRKEQIAKATKDVFNEELMGLASIGNYDIDNVLQHLKMS